MNGKETHRVYATLNMELYRALRVWAAKENRPVSLQATHLLEKDIRAAISDGTIPPLGPSPQSDDYNEGELILKEALRKMIEGQLLTPDEEESIARASNKSPAQVHDVVKRLRERGQ